MYVFPESKVIQDYLVKTSILSYKIVTENDMHKTIIDLAAKRFAKSKLTEDGVENMVSFLIYDLQSGKDGYTGAEIPKIILPDFFWSGLQNRIGEHLKNCAVFEQVSKI